MLSFAREPASAGVTESWRRGASEEEEVRVGELRWGSARSGLEGAAVLAGIW